MMRTQARLELAGLLVSLVGMACVGKTSAETVPRRLETLRVPPKPVQGCDSPFAIADVPSDQASCEVPGDPAHAWKVVPRFPASTEKVPTGRAYSTPPLNPMMPRRAAPEGKGKGKGFCVYEWTGDAAPTARDFAAIHATQECALSVAMAPPSPSETALGRAFDRQVRGFASPEAAKTWQAAVKKSTAPPPRISVFDGSPFGVTKPDKSGHGFAVSRIIASLACVDPNSPDCADRIRPYVALPLEKHGKKWVRGPNGGHLGYFHDLFDTMEAALDAHVPKQHEIFNLSLGWDPIKTDPAGLETRHIKELLDRAFCEGVLVVAAVGNGRASPGALIPAALESVAPPDPKLCAELGFPPALPAAKAPNLKAGIGHYRPLINGVSSVNIYDERLTTVRPWANSRMAAYGVAVAVPAPTPTGYTMPSTGTSASAAIVSGIAAAVWQARADLDASGVMDVVYAGGRLLDAKAGDLQSRTEVCLDTKRDRCQSWQVRRASLCGALNVALGASKLKCLDPTSPVPADVFPPPPSTTAKASASDGPCRIANCGIPLGLPTEQSPTKIMAEGVSTCAACLLDRNFFGPGNSRLSGTASSTPDPPFSTVLNIYYGPQYNLQALYPFSDSQPVSDFDMRLPDGANTDTRAAELVWSFESFGTWNSDPPVYVPVKKN